MGAASTGGDLRVTTKMTTAAITLTAIAAKIIRDTIRPNRGLPVCSLMVFSNGCKG
jgi:hypothetical protein